MTTEQTKQLFDMLGTIQKQLGAIAAELAAIKNNTQPQVNRSSGYARQ